MTRQRLKANRVELIDRPSPNYDERRPPGHVIDILLLHYTGMPSAEEAIERLCDRDAHVSAHYAVMEDGQVIRMVKERYRAWHAGVSLWSSDRDINYRSIGIEIINPGHEFGYRAFPDAQIDAVIELSKGILSRHPIPVTRVLGHSDVAPTRKEDPGELFPWARLAQDGIGQYVDPDSVVLASADPLKLGDEGDAVGVLQDRFKLFGYGLETTSVFDDLTKAVVTAFQRHYRPSNFDGVADPQTQALLECYLNPQQSTIA